MLEVTVERDLVANTLRKLTKLGVHHILEVISVEDPAVITVAHSIVASPFTLDEVADEMKNSEGVSGVVTTTRRA